MKDSFLDELYKQDHFQDPEELYNLKEDSYDPKKAYTSYIECIKLLQLSDNEIIDFKLNLLLIVLHNTSVIWGETHQVFVPDKNDPYSFSSLFKFSSSPEALKTMLLFSNEETDSSSTLSENSDNKAVKGGFRQLGGVLFQEYLPFGTPHGRCNFHTLLRRSFEMLFATEYPVIKDKEYYGELIDKIISAQILAAGKTNLTTRQVHDDATIYYDYPISMVGNLLFQLRQKWYHPVTYKKKQYPSVYEIDYLAGQIYKMSKGVLPESPDSPEKILRKFHSIIDEKLSEENILTSETEQRLYYIKGIRKIYKQHYADIKLILLYMSHIIDNLNKLSRYPELSIYSTIPQEKDFPELFYMIFFDFFYMVGLEKRASKKFPLLYNSKGYEHPFFRVGKNVNNLNHIPVRFLSKYLTPADDLLEEAKNLSSENDRPLSKEGTKRVQNLKEDFDSYIEKFSPTQISVLAYKNYLNEHCSKCPYIIEADKEKRRLMRCSLPFGCLSCEHHLGILDELKRVYKVLHP